jgi:hypothetical protein
MMNDSQRHQDRAARTKAALVAAGLPVMRTSKSFHSTSEWQGLDLPGVRTLAQSDVTPR